MVTYNISEARCPKVSILLGMHYYAGCSRPGHTLLHGIILVLSHLRVHDFSVQRRFGAGRFSAAISALADHKFSGSKFSLKHIVFEILAF